MAKSYNAEPAMTIDPNKTYTATIDTTAGEIKLELYPKDAPHHVNSWVFLARDGFYNDVIFHRVIPGFMIQGGDPLGVGTGGPGYEFVNEVNNGLAMKPGTLAMANAGPDTNGSQFFITETAPSQLNDHYSIFGQCKEVDLVKKIASVPRNRQDKPDSPVTITKVTISKG